MRRWLALSIPVLLAGCAFAKGEPFNAASLPPLAPQNARIIVFRQTGTLGAGANIPVTLDGKPLTALPQNGYFWRDVPVGTHELEASATLWAGTAKLGGELQAGRIIYVEASYANDAFQRTVGPGGKPGMGVAWFGPGGIFSTSDTEQRGLYRLVETPAGTALLALAKARLAVPPVPSLPGGDAPTL
jgi:hypothetical protein